MSALTREAVYYGYGTALEISMPSALPDADQQLVTFVGYKDGYKERDRLKQYFAGSAVGETAIRHIQGPHHTELNDLLAETHQELEAIGAAPADLVPPSHRHPEAAPARHSYHGFIPRDIEEELSFVKSKHRKRLNQAARDWDEQEADIVIPQGTFSDIPYLRQGLKGSTLCMNAGFRMTFAAITGRIVRENSVEVASRSIFNSPIPTTEQYLGALGSPAFKDRFATTVNVLSITGADLSTISKLSTRVRAKQPTAKLVCLTQLLTETPALGRDNAWHCMTLLATDKDSVTVHDPSDNAYGSAFRVLPRSDFYQRWASAHNRVDLAIAV